MHTHAHTYTYIHIHTHIHTHIYNSPIPNNIGDSRCLGVRDNDKYKWETYGQVLYYKNIQSILLL